MTSAALLLLADARFPTGAHAHSGGIEAAHAAGDVSDLDSLAWFIDGRLATTALVDATFTAAATHHAGSHPSPTLPGPSSLRTSALATSGGGTSHGGSERQKSSATEVPGGAGDGWAELDSELGARIPSPRLRNVSRALGRQLLRAGERAWPSPIYAGVRAASATDVAAPNRSGSAAAGTRDPYQPIALGVVAAAAGLGPEDAALCAFHHQIGTWTTGAVRLLGLDPFAVHALAARLAPRLESLAAEAAALATTMAPCDLPSTSSPLGDILAEHHATWEVRLFAS